MFLFDRPFLINKNYLLQPCLITSEYHVMNNVGDIPYICSWDDCVQSCVGIQEFIDHVHYHVKWMTKKKLMKCLWTGKSY